MGSKNETSELITGLISDKTHSIIVEDIVLHH